MRVLVVEDARRLADAIARGLRGEGMAVDVAYDGIEGHQKSTFTSYDVVVLDRDLPGCTAMTCWPRSSPPATSTGC